MWGYFDILGHSVLLGIELNKNVHANETKLYIQHPAPQVLLLTQLPGPPNHAIASDSAAVFRNCNVNARFRRLPRRGRGSQ